MLPKRSKDNLYSGINAHLQSELLARGSWTGYHGALISALAGVINQELPPGFIALSEESIQMRRPDVHIQQTQEWVSGGKALLPSPFQPDTRVQELSSDLLLIDIDEDTEELLSVGIYVDDPANGIEPGEKLLAWMELLSPSNKVGDKLLKYRTKRDDLIQQGITFLEIDLIHGVSTSLSNIPDYQTPGAEAERHPYAIWFIDPRRLPDGHQITALAQFDVNESIPRVRLRLEENDTVLVKLGDAVGQMFAINPGWGRQVDYAQPPKNVSTYTQFRDLVMIAALMVEIGRLHEASVDLDALAAVDIPPALLSELNHAPERVAEMLGLDRQPHWRPSQSYNL